MQTRNSNPQADWPEALLRSLLEQGSVHIGEIAIERDGSDFVLLGPPGEVERQEMDLPTEAFRQWVRRTEEGAYRPLSGALTLRRGWKRRCAGLAQLIEDLDAIYPMALQHLHLFRQGRLPGVGPSEVLARQGVLKDGEEAEPALAETVTASLCSRCARVPAWGDRPNMAANAIPCPEPCSLWVSLYRVGAGWGDERPEPAEPDLAVGFAEFTKPGNPTREALLRHLVAPSDGVSGKTP